VDGFIFATVGSDDIDLSKAISGKTTLFAEGMTVVNRKLMIPPGSQIIFGGKSPPPPPPPMPSSMNTIRPTTVAPTTPRPSPTSFPTTSSPTPKPPSKNLTRPCLLILKLWMISSLVYHPDLGYVPLIPLMGLSSRRSVPTLIYQMLRVDERHYSQKG